MTVLIDSTTYHAFYEVFKAAFLKITFPDGKSPYGRGDDSPEIWREQDEKGNYRVHTMIGGSYPKDPMYFSRMRSVLKTVHGKPTESGINAQAIYGALVFLGYKLPDGMKSLRNFPVKEKAKILIEQFKTEKFGEGWTASRDNKDLEKACTTVENFYKYLATGDTQSAWNLLSPTFQNREVWSGDYERFRDGYATTIALRDIRAFNPKQIVQKVIECKVFYEDEVLTYPINGLPSIKTMTIGEVEDFVKGVKKIKADIEKKGGSGFENVPIEKLFNPTGMEFIWYECGFKGEELHRFFAKPHSEIVYRLYNCSCIFIGDKWLINSIMPVPTYAVR